MAVLREDVYALAMQLPPAEKKKLIEDLQSEVSEVEDTQSTQGIASIEQQEGDTWGEMMLRLLDTLDVDNYSWDTTKDRVQWLENIRAADKKNRGIDVSWRSA